MALSNFQYESIMRTYEKKQLASRHLLDMRLEEIYQRLPSYQTLTEQAASLSVSQGKKLLEGDTDAVPTLKILLADISRRKQRLLEEGGFPPDYLNPVYDCPDCQDTGYMDNQKCHCFRQAMITKLYEQSNIQEILNNENFSSLSEEFFQGEDLVRFQNAVSACKNFVNTFKKDYRNLFFYGTVGTGKSFLSGCIAKELIELGQSVIYFSASQLFEYLSITSFDYKNKEELYNLYDDLYNCDLLIIDDLGTETQRANVSSRLFSCLNERHLRKKSSIISTNLSLEELRNRYSERIFSRITSNYDVCKLSGPDIRMYKKRMNNRK